MKICLLALDQMIATSLTLPLEMMTAAGHMIRAGRLPYPTPETLVAGYHQQPVTTTGGLQILPTTDIHSLPVMDIVFIPSFWRNPLPLLDKWPELGEWLTSQYNRGARLCATGTGVFLLAAAGLLDNRPATTHWFYLDLLEKRFPDALVKRHHLLTQAGRIYCAGSVNSIADLTIHLIDNTLSNTLASRVSQQFSPEIRRRYSEVFYAFESGSSHTDETIILVQQWLHEHQHRPVSMKELATQFSMSQRTLNRRFQEAAGISPVNWLLKLRMETARDLLASTNLAIADIAQHCGFQDTGYFNRVFRKHMDTTPGQFRLTVRGKLFTA